MYLLIGFAVILCMIAIGLVVSVRFARPEQEHENRLTPFAVLMIANGSPSERAFLEYYASQMAWMDSSILKYMLLVYPDELAEAKHLCKDMSREYAFFTAVSLSELHALLNRQYQTA